MEKTLGGDRLGSGNKMKVELHGYGRSTHDLGQVTRTTMAPGTLVPVYKKVALAGDTWDIDLDAFSNTHPTIGPLFGGFKLQIDVFQCPVRLYNAHLHNNTLGIGLKMNTVKLPLITFQALPSDPDVEDQDNSQVNPSSIVNYLGMKGIGVTAANQNRSFNAVPIIAYWDIYKNYYANKQEEIGAVIHTPAEALVETVDDITIDNQYGNNQPLSGTAPGTGSIELDNTALLFINYTGTSPIPSQIMITTPSGRRSFEELCTGIFDNGLGVISGTYNFGKWGASQAWYWSYITAADINNRQPAVVTFPLSEIDDMRTKILGKQTYDAFEINTDAATLRPYKWLYEQPEGIPNILSSQEGLGIKTYQSDLFNNWLSTEWIDGAGGINEITSVSTAGDSFTIDSLILARKVWAMLNRIVVAGGSYQDWNEAVYGKKVAWQATTPMYCGGLIKEVIFQEVISNSESATGGEPLGTLAGKGTLGSKHKGGKVVIHVDEASYIMVIASLTPRLDYSQGNDWDIHLKTMDDFFKPALDELGFQELITEQMNWRDTKWDGTKWVQKSAGKQPAWLNYMTAVNKNYGNFAVRDNEMFMVLDRRYEMDGDGIKDLTTYIDPSKFNFIFAETNLDAQNFWMQIGINATVRRVMSGKLMPNL
ncbi:MAG: major capsid protein [Microviridae sp.]|nr:MAG: major capsid protein [Microviridae sp.]